MHMCQTAANLLLINLIKTPKDNIENGFFAMRPIESSKYEILIINTGIVVLSSGLPLVEGQKSGLGVCRRSIAQCKRLYKWHNIRGQVHVVDCETLQSFE